MATDPLAGVTIPADVLQDPEFRQFVEDGVWEAREALALQHRGPLASQDTIVLAEEAVAQADNLLGGWNMERLQRMMQRLRLSPKQQELIIRRPDQLGLT
jgi:hypothetical protein